MGLKRRSRAAAKLTEFFHKVITALPLGPGLTSSNVGCFRVN